MSKKLIISLVIGSLVSALTLYLSFRNVPLDQLATYLRTINYWYLVPLVALVIVTFILRTFRWQIILGNIERIEFWQAFHPLIIGFMLNCILPGRVGELARPVLLRQKRGVSVTTGIATVAAERIFDIAALILLFTIVFSTVASRPDLKGDYFGFHLNSAVLKSAAWGMIRLSAVLIGCLTLLIIGTTRRLIKTVLEKTGRLLAARIPRFQNKIHRIVSFMTSIIDNFAAGLSLVRSPGSLLGCVGLTFLIWGLTAFSYYIFAKGCPGLQLSFMEFTTVMVVICFAIALPSVPGFWGLWEAGGVFALSIFGVAEKDALGFTLVNHAAQVFPVIVMGLISALITSVNILNLTLDEGGTRKNSQTSLEGV
jgi:glycosyltransferase 2 family protein